MIDLAKHLYWTSAMKTTMGIFIILLSIVIVVVTVGAGAIYLGRLFSVRWKNEAACRIELHSMFPAGTQSQVIDKWLTQQKTRRGGYYVFNEDTGKGQISVEIYNAADATSIVGEVMSVNFFFDRNGLLSQIEVERMGAFP